jgi:hypothetical protein
VTNVPLMMVCAMLLTHYGAGYSYPTWLWVVAIVCWILRGWTTRALPARS